MYVLRDWKEYLGESFLIIFSVLLALFLTEFINNLHEKSDTKEMLGNIKAELTKNKEAETAQYAYEKQVLARIDSALANKALQAKIVADDQFNDKLLFPEGVVNRDLSSTAWDIARQHNLAAKLNFKLVSQLTDLYADQSRILKLEDEVAGVIFSRESRNPANAHLTLVLLRDNYRGWAFDRAPCLLKRYNDAIKAIDENGE